MINDFLNRIKSSYTQFTKAEKKVADFILSNPRQAIFMSITDLALACGVGDTSVFRFCRTMKLQGYQEFKMQLSLSLTDEAKIELSGGALPINLEDSFEVLSRKLMQNHMNAIAEAHSLLNADEFARAMYYLETVERVYFFGVGTSMITALAAMNKFLRITPNVYSLMDAHMQNMAASMLTPKDLAIIISYSGSTKDSIHVAKLAKESGAKVVSITRHLKSPLTAYCDVILQCGSHEGPLEGGSTSALISELYLLDLLYMEFYKKRYDFSLTNNQKTSASVLDKLY